MLVKSAVLIFLIEAAFAKKTVVGPSPGPITICGPQQCASDGIPVCGLYNGNHRTFADHCAMKAHNCDTDDSFIEVNFDDCPPPPWPFPCPDIVDYVCATALGEGYSYYENHCHYNNFLMIVRKVYWKVTLNNCIGQPGFPASICSGLTSSLQPVCGFNPNLLIGNYQIFSNMEALNQKKCFEDGNWQRVSMIYC